MKVPLLAIQNHGVTNYSMALLRRFLPASDLRKLGSIVYLANFCATEYSFAHS